MINSFLIKEARESKKLSQEQLAEMLKLDVSIIKDIESGKKLEGIYSFYEKSYRGSIYKILGLKLEKKIKEKKNDLKNNFRILIIIYFLIFVVFTFLTLSYFIIYKYAGNSNNFNAIKFYKEDNIIQLLKKNTTYSNVKFIDNNIFLNSLKFVSYSKKNIFFEIKVKQGSQAYYKIYYLNKDIEEFGMLKSEDSILIKEKYSFYLDFSDISTIDYIIFDNIKYYNLSKNRAYLRKFDINKLHNLK